MIVTHINVQSSPARRANVIWGAGPSRLRQIKESWFGLTDKEKAAIKAQERWLKAQGLWR